MCRIHLFLECPTSAVTVGIFLFWSVGEMTLYLISNHIVKADIFSFNI